MAHFASLLLIALIFSILLEWTGIIFWWPEQGARHSEQMLANELEYLNDDFERGILPSRPIALARAAARKVRAALRSLGVDQLLTGGRSPGKDNTGWGPLVRGVLSGSEEYLTAMTNVLQVFAVRLVVLALASPAFALFGVVGLTEGLMRRDLRRWGGGRESSFLYHHSKKLVVPSLWAAWMLYLAMPVSVHPNLVILPFAAAFAIGVATTMTTFKKYL